MTRSVPGPATLSVFIPFLSSTTRFYTINTTIGNVTWREWDKSMSLYAPNGWTNGSIVVFFDNLQSFSINNLGVPVVGDNLARLSVKGLRDFLPPIPVTTVSPVAVVQYSSVRFESTISNVFANVSNIFISFNLNMKALPFDVFTFQLYGIQGKGQQNFTINGDCAILASDFYSPFSSTKTFPNDTLSVTFSNSTACQSGRNIINWTITKSVGLSGPMAVVQQNSRMFKMSWNNIYFNTGNLQ